MGRCEIGDGPRLHGAMVSRSPRALDPRRAPAHAHDAATRPHDRRGAGKVALADLALADLASPDRVDAFETAVLGTQAAVGAAGQEAPKAAAHTCKDEDHEPKSEARPLSWEENRAAQALRPGEPKEGKFTSTAMMQDELEEVKGGLEGPELYLNDNPETFRHAGLLGSTIQPMEGRSGDSRHVFVGEARLLELAQNRVVEDGKQVPLHNAVVVKSYADVPVVFRFRGVVYTSETKTDGSIRKNYKMNGGFQGPQAIVASSYLAPNHKPNQNGWVDKSIAIGPGGIAVVDDLEQKFGHEIFRYVTISASKKDASFGLATVASREVLDQKGLDAIAKGTYQSAGCERADQADYAPATDSGSNGRPNGVLSGSVFRGGRPIVLKDGLRDGDLVMATRFRNTEPGSGKVPAEIGRLDAVPGNPPTRGKAAVLDEGNYGVEYKLDYTLVNPTPDTLDVEVYFTAPPKNGEERRQAKLHADGKETEKDHAANPVGGLLTLPVIIGTKTIKVRIDVRGEGQLLDTISVASRKEQKVPIRFVNVGNTSPPAGIEFRVKKQPAAK